MTWEVFLSHNFSRRCSRMGLLSVPAQESKLVARPHQRTVILRGGSAKPKLHVILYRHLSSLPIWLDSFDGKETQVQLSLAETGRSR